MRTTLDIDDDVLAVAKERARLEKKTAGEVISELARRALTSPTHAGPPGMSEEARSFDDGSWPALPNRAGLIVTWELADRIIEELDHEDAEIKDFTKVGGAG